MDTLFLYNTKTLKDKFKTKVFAGDNHITKINVQIPDNIGGYPKRECEYNLRAIIPEGNLSYIIEPSQPYFYVTNDITEKAQTVKLMMIITHEGNVIGRTNTVDLVVNEPAEAPDPPLTPREQFDEVIAEQRAEIAEQAETISTQGETITQQTEQITELNDEITEKDGQIAELTNENTRLENLTDTQEETIKYLRDNPPQPKLYTPPEPIIPESETRVYTPPQNYDGFASFTVTGTSYMNIDLQKWVNQNPDDEPFEMIFEKAVRNYIAYRQIKMIKATILTATSIGVSAFYGCTALIKVNLPDSLTSIGQNAFQNCSSLTEINLPNSLTSIGQSAFYNCQILTEVNLPNSLTSIGSNVFQNCTSLTNLTLAQGFNCNGLNVSWSTLYTVETIVSWLEALADRTGETSYTLTMGTTNLNKLTNEQKAIATNKNWNLA